MDVYGRGGGIFNDSLEERFQKTGVFLPMDDFRAPRAELARILIITRFYGPRKFVAASRKALARRPS